MTQMRRWREYLITLTLAVLSALFVRSYFIAAYKVPTGSMQPTLKPGDFLFSSRVSYGLRLPFGLKKIEFGFPSRADLVVFSYPNHPEINYVKRVVGLPGDRVQIIKGRLFLNEEPLEYQKSAEGKGDNPNSEIFEVFDEKFKDSHWKVIFQKHNENKDFGPIIVPTGELFLLGDNRDASDDSRYWGTVSSSQVLGKVVFIWMSLDWKVKWGGDLYPTVRWSRVFNSVR